MFLLNGKAVWEQEEKPKTTVEKHRPKVVVFCQNCKWETIYFSIKFNLDEVLTLGQIWEKKNKRTNDQFLSKIALILKFRQKILFGVFSSASQEVKVLTANETLRNLRTNPFNISGWKNLTNFCLNLFFKAFAN